MTYEEIAKKFPIGSRIVSYGPDASESMQKLIDQGKDVRVLDYEQNHYASDSYRITVSIDGVRSPNYALIPENYNVGTSDDNILDTLLR